MANSPFRDGDQVFVEMFLKNASGGREDVINLNVMGNHIMDFYFVEQQGKAANFSLKLYDATFDALEDVIFAGGALNPTNKSDQGAIPVISARWGWVNGDRRVESPVWDMRLTKYRSKFKHGQGTELELEGIAAPGAIFKRGNLFAGPGTEVAGGLGSSLQTLVAVIAQNNGMDADVEPGEILQSVRQNNKNDFLWLKNIVQYAVKSSSGNRNYEVWIRNRGLGKPELVVRTQKTSDATQTWDYLYGVDRDGQVIEYETEIQSNLLFNLGAGGFRTVLLDPKTKEFKEVITNSKSIPGVAGEGKFIPQDSNTPTPLRLGFQDEEAMKAYAASKYLQLNSTNIKSRLVVHGNPTINPSDLVNVILLRGTQSIRDIRDLHPTSGAYNIKAVTHSISDGSYTTEIDLFRRGNLTENSGGSERTTGSEAATNQVKKASEALNSNVVTNEMKIKKANEDPVSSDTFKAALTEKYRGGN